MSSQIIKFKFVVIVGKKNLKHWEFFLPKNILQDFMNV